MLSLTGEEQRLIGEFFADTPKGFFVEVGANDPFARSQTWHLEQMGWTGILVEPQPDLAAKLVRARRSKVFAVACSSYENSGRTLTLHVAGPLSSLNRERMAPGAVPERTIDVPIKTLDEILAEGDAPAPVDFLSIDVEGHEIEVLRGFDFSRWMPRLILLEDHVESLEKHRFITRAGYRIVRRYENNGWYVPANSPHALQWPDMWEVLRKYYLALPVRMVRNMLRAVRSRDRA